MYWWLRWLWSAINLPRTIAGLALPARIAMLVVLFEFALVSLSLLWGWVDDSKGMVGSELLEKWPTLTVVVILLPLVTYWAVELWSEEDVGRWPDIDTAWRLLADAITASGISIEEWPLFLVVGCPGYEEEDGLLQACGWQFTKGLSGIPSVKLLGDQEPPVRAWVGDVPDPRGNDDPTTAIVLCIATAARSSVWARGRRRFDGGSDDAVLGRTYFNGGAVGRPEDSRRQGQGFVAATREWVTAGVARIAKRVGSGSRRSGSSQYTDEQIGDRMRYLCTLIRRSRHGFEPCNGILAVAPWRLLTGQSAVRDVARRLADDLRVVREAAGVTVPVRVLVTGMEELAGLKSVYDGVPSKARVGAGVNDCGMVPSADRLESFVGMFVARMEEAVWAHLQGKEDAFWEKPREAHDFVRLLFRLCQVRETLFGLLKDVFAAETADGHPFFGCYFSITGPVSDDGMQSASHPRDDRTSRRTRKTRAESSSRRVPADTIPAALPRFVAGVFAGMHETRDPIDYVSWTEDAIYRDRLCHAVTRWLLASNVIGVTVFGCFIAWRHLG